jgi:HEAT repeat protein
MREILLDLIARMTAKEARCLNSDDSVAWHAYREAEKLEAPSLVEEVAAFLQHEREKDRRRAAYFILGRLGRKVRAPECSSILLSYLDKETDKYVLSHLLNAIRDIRKPRHLDLSPLFRRLEDDRWLVRYSAIEALRYTDSPEPENRLLQLLQITTDPNDMIYCQATLSEIGTAKALPFIEKNLKSRKRDVSMSSQFANEAIKAREKLPNDGKTNKARRPMGLRK